MLNIVCYVQNKEGVWARGVGVACRSHKGPRERGQIRTILRILGAKFLTLGDGTREYGKGEDGNKT